MENEKIKQEDLKISPINFKEDNKHADLTCSIPLSLEFPEVNIQNSLEKPYNMNEYSILSPCVNNIQSIPFLNYGNIKGKNLFAESPYRMNNTMSVHFHSSPLGIKIGNSFLKNTQEGDNFLESQNENNGGYYYSFINSIKNVRNNNILRHLDFESSKDVKEANFEVRMLKSENLINRVVEMRKNEYGSVARNLFKNNNFNANKENNVNGNNKTEKFIINNLNSQDINLTNKSNGEFKLLSNSTGKPRIVSNFMEELNRSDLQQTFKKLNFPMKQEIQSTITSLTNNKPVNSCKCKKSKCLKLYCECFANGGYCKDCNCTSCHNTIEHEDERQKMIEYIKERNTTGFNNEEIISKGCNCTKSHCKKKYCECFNKGIECSDQCRCLSCNNNAHKKSLQAPRKAIIINKTIPLEPVPFDNFTIESNNSICYNPYIKSTVSLLGNKVERSSKITKHVSKLKKKKAKKNNMNIKTLINRANSKLASSNNNIVPSQLETPKKKDEVIFNTYSNKKYRDTTLTPLITTTAATTTRKRGLISKLDTNEHKEVARKLNMQVYEVKK